eukprot:TRINITY_DN10213_c0_g1_i7.p1 TRINITY_DN10213_c0_g1~~TRINITY_DN10213_c0_g1_i7.p1  ORF type:complete len:714 (+),score=162.61 TRINITY_DN10213_c0_g1_i7:29-2143(+)
MASSPNACRPFCCPAIKDVPPLLRRFATRPPSSSTQWPVAQQTAVRFVHKECGVSIFSDALRYGGTSSREVFVRSQEDGVWEGMTTVVALEEAVDSEGPLQLLGDVGALGRPREEHVESSLGRDSLRLCAEDRLDPFIYRQMESSISDTPALGNGSLAATATDVSDSQQHLAHGENGILFSTELKHEDSIGSLETAGREDTTLTAGPLDSPREDASLKETTGKSNEGESVVTQDEIRAEVARRRNFAIISHPDAGKTTLTEKLLLYGGAIHEAGAVKARRAARHATSDWMELEKQRGISITSTAMVFETKGLQITLLDTPGHQDFGEDTYRTLAAADNAVMLVDGGKGLEPQTRKLFEVCRMRKLPVFTFINKMDRPSLSALELLDEIEKEFSLATYPVNWPIGSGDRFLGVLHRPTKEVHLFSRTELHHGSREAKATIVPLGDPSLADVIDSDLYEQLMEEAELLDEVAPPLDLDAVHAGDLTPVFFGSAMNNFGVQLFLESFLQLSVAPGGHDSDLGEVRPDYPHFTGFVFKLQANMDPKHRDKVAFVRVCSGRFEKGMKVQLARTGRTISLTRPQKLFAQDRSVMESGYAGDVIGLNNPNTFAIGDTIYCGPRRAFPAIPSFSPELFAYMRSLNPSKYKQFQKGVSELLGEGAVQVLYSVDSSRTDPILAAVGQLQFEVSEHYRNVFWCLCFIIVLHVMVM